MRLFCLAENPTRKKCCEIRCEMSGENEGNLRKLGEGLKRRFPSVDAGLLTFSGRFARGLLHLSRPPDSVTLVPLRGPNGP
jgi:hypothetical protein